LARRLFSYNARMDAIQLMACSGPGAMQAIAESELYATILVMVSAALAALAVLVSWMRPPSLWGTLTIAGMTVVHPGLWVSAIHGDCGDALRLYSTVWTAVIAVSGVVVVWNSRGRKWHPNDS